VHYHENALDKKERRINLLVQHVQRVTARQARLQQLNDRYVRLRLAVFAAGAVLSLITILLAGPAAFWVPFVLSAAIFFGVVFVHRRVTTALQQGALWLGHQTAQIARARLDWEHIPHSTAGTMDRQHPFAADLDILGDRSVHQLLNTATTAEGAGRLAEWLTTLHPDEQVILARQRLVQELVPLAHFRDRLILRGEVTTDGVALPWATSSLLENLAHEPVSNVQKWTLFGSLLLAALNIVLFVLNALGALPPVWTITWALYLVLFFSNAGAIRGLFDKTLDAQTHLHRLRAVFRLLERWDYTGTSGLRALCTPFLDRTWRPSALLSRLNRILAAASLQQNLFLWLPINLLVPWDIVCADQLHHCEVELTSHLPVWLDTWHELEALSALANYAYLNPNTTLPRLLVEQPMSPVFTARALGHPLIPDCTRVSNDFSLPAVGDVALITGSNMSGKSSFLRTLGVNLCLAYAGAPVCASHMETALFRLYTCIAVSDSVVDGISYFYAEVKRLKHLLDALEADAPQPLFFLIDEIFKGTNNRERLIGSRSYVHALAGRHGLGAISTHDLELTRLSEEIPQLANYHFREHLDHDRLVFDYLMRPGPSPSTNALRIMQQEGLPVMD
jgi:hypothetical protein